MRHVEGALCMCEYGYGSHYQSVVPRSVSEGVCVLHVHLYVQVCMPVANEVQSRTSNCLLHLFFAYITCKFARRTVTRWKSDQ